MRLHAVVREFVVVPYCRLSSLCLLFIYSPVLKRLSLVCSNPLSAEQNPRSRRRPNLPQLTLTCSSDFDHPPTRVPRRDGEEGYEQDCDNQRFRVATKQHQCVHLLFGPSTLIYCILVLLHLPHFT